MQELMTPENNRWEEFIELLEGEDGCNFKNGENGITWICDSSKNRPLATNILKKMGNINIPDTLKFFDKHGGHCDCEILFNVNK